MDSNHSTPSFAKVGSSNAGNGSGATLDSEDTEDAKDEEASSNSNKIHNELDDFRRKWHSEIKVSPAIESSSNNTSEPSTERTEDTSNNDVSLIIEEQARSLFLCGVQAERCGRLESAISFYRRAVQLVPDIEFRVTDYSNDNTNSNSFSEDSDDSSDREDMLEDNAEPETYDLLEKLEKVAFNVAIAGICQPKHEQQATHISVLPPEIFMFILKWVVSSDLDMRSLESISKVCRGFYLCARDSEIWRLACMRVWEANLGSPNKYGSWRNMFIQRPHLLFNGSYISKTTYIRYGEPSFQDTNYRPCYLVSYFRYFRFFPDGIVLMLTTPEDPYHSLYKLCFRKPKSNSVFTGWYKIIGNMIVAVVKKQKESKAFYRCYARRQANPPPEQTFHVELELRNVKNKNNCQLIWKRYSIHEIYRNGEETVSDFDLTPKNFPPFWFSRVISYTAESEQPLK